MVPSPFDAITRTASITVLTSKDCPNCARVVQQAHELQERCELVSVHIVDVFDAESLRARHEIRSVPATIIDGDFSIEGQVTSRRLAEILASRGTPTYDENKVRALLDAQRIDAAAAFLREPGKSPSVLPIIASGELSDRMGVTLVIQTAHEVEPGSLSDLVPGLIDLLSSDNPSLRGDIADLLGTLGDPRAVQPLQALLGDTNHDVVDAARDALDSIKDGMN